MALATRGSRTLTVDGTRYRWTVSPDASGLAVVVGWADGDGARMVTWLEHGTVIAPGVVAGLIRTALQHGWRPRQCGPEIIFRSDEDGYRAL
ncbi:hypothetical protein AB0D04_27310 [Streptomyces sp. NPDC048483]|uniref:hypothetical protein n=1 Tax=Streptomyces sp. NPDC048483 TaxID=3154927 RepID=UPI0034168CA7